MDVVATNSIDDSLITKKSEGVSWRTGRKKEVLKARNKNMKRSMKF